MHEFSIAASVIESIKEIAEKEGLSQVNKINLVIGNFTSIHIESLLFAFDNLKNEPLIKNMEIKIEQIPLEIRCRLCGEISNPDDIILVCSKCGSLNVEIKHGKEFYIKSIEGV